MNPKEATGFRGISLKKELIEEIENFMKEHPERYKSTAEFVSEAVRLRIEELTDHYLKRQKLHEEKP